MPCASAPTVESTASCDGIAPSGLALSTTCGMTFASTSAAWHGNAELLGDLCELIGADSLLHLLTADGLVLPLRDPGACLRSGTLASRPDMIFCNPPPARRPPTTGINMRPSAGSASGRRASHRAHRSVRRAIHPAPSRSRSFPPSTRRQRTESTPACAETQAGDALYASNRPTSSPTCGLLLCPPPA